MKKKYRRAVCKVLLVGIILPVYRGFYYLAKWMMKTPTKQRPQKPRECKWCINNHCQHPYYNDCDCTSWSRCDFFTPKTQKQ